MMGQTCIQRQAVEVGAIRKPRQVVSLDDICQLQAQYTESCKWPESSSISGLGRQETLGVNQRKQASGKRDGAVGVRTDQLMLLASETDPNMAYESKNYGIAKYLHRTS